MKSKKTLWLYVLLLGVVIATMIYLLKINTYTSKEYAIRDLPQIEEEGILRIATEYSQLDYYVAGDTLEGFQYELSQAISQISGLEVQIQLVMSLSDSFKDLFENKCDIIARNIPITRELKEDYLFTDPIILNKQVLVQRKADVGEKDLVRNQLDLAKKKIYIPKDSPANLRLKNLSREIGDTIYIMEDDLYSGEQLAIMVAKGDIDYAVCDQQTAQNCQKELPEIDIETDISFTQLQSWALRKSSPILRDSINSWLNQIHINGIYDKIYRKYYN